MAITVFNSTATLAEVSTGTAITVNVPASVAAGDLLACSVSVAASTVAGTLSGWTTALTLNLGSSASIAIYYRIATGSEPASYTLTGVSGASGRISASMLRLSGVDNTTPLDVAAQSALNAGGGNFAAAQVTTVTAATAILYTVGADAATSSDFTVPTGTTLIKDSTGTGKRLVTAFETQASAGTSASRTFTETGTVIVDGAITVAFRPSAGGGSSFSGSAALAGSGTLTTSAVASPTGSSAFTGSGALAIAGRPALAGAAAFTGTGTLAASGPSTFSGTAAFTGTGSLAGATSGPGSGSAAFTGNGLLAGSGVPAIPAVAAFSGGSQLSAARIVPTYYFTGVLRQRRVPILPPLVALMNYSCAVLRVNGQWVEAEYPTAEQIAAADLYFPGGYQTVVDEATAQTLIAAGYVPSLITS